MVLETVQLTREIKQTMSLEEFTLAPNGIRKMFLFGPYEHCFR